MNEPLSGAGASALVFGAGVLNLVFKQDPEVMMCAFFGAVVFVLSAKESSRIERFVFLFVSFWVGVLGAEFGGRVLSGLLPDGYAVPASIAALFVSAVVVRLLQFSIRRASNPELPEFLGRRKNERDS